MTQSGIWIAILTGAAVSFLVKSIFSALTVVLVDICKCLLQCFITFT